VGYRSESRSDQTKYNRVAIRSTVDTFTATPIYLVKGVKMKTAIYIEDGVTQLVITPENDWEKSAIKTLGKAGIEAEVYEGSFYNCQGGYVRQNRDESLIIKVSKNSQKEVGE